MSKLLVILCSLFATTAVFGQTLTWIGLSTGGNSSNIGVTTNWSGGSPLSGTLCVWDGSVSGNLVLFSQDGIDHDNGSFTFPSVGPIGGSFGANGISIQLTSGQTNSLNLISPVPTAVGMGFNGIQVDSGAGQLILGENTANQIIATLRPSASLHTWINNSANPVIINPSWQLQNGGGQAGHVMDFQGTGDWAITNNLRNNNNAPSMNIQLDLSGTVTWTAGGPNNLFNGAQGTITINTGTLIVKSAGLIPNTPGANTVTNNGTLLKFDAPAQSDTITRVISGAGPLQVNNGTWTFTGANTYTNNTILSGGELIAGSTENVGVSGPLGVGGTISFTGGTLGFSVNNVFDYSPRFNTAAAQAYSFDTGGQNVTFTNTLSSSGATFTKIGSGTLTLAGTSTYSGLTTVSAGKLVLQGSKTGSGNITVADSAALGVMDNGTQVTPGTLTMGTSSGATLEFNNVNSTTTAPLAPATLSSAGTVTINVNSGALSPGQSYPLFSWTSGSAPAVSLGILNGFIGNVSTNGNSIKLNVIATAYSWTGNNNDSWDLSTPNNWFQNGGPAVFANGGPVLFDDTSTRTNVTINALVQPTVVTVNSETNAYTITSSSGNVIGGSASLIKSGNGTLTLSGGVNAYTGVTTISGGILGVGALANGGAASDIGAASSSASNLVLNGGTLQYTGTGTSIDRLFTLSTSGGTIDDSGSGALVFNNTGSLGYIGNGPRTLTLRGNVTDNNTLAVPLANNGGATSLIKNGPGKWILTGNSTYSGATTIANGLLQVGAGGASGALGTGSIVNNATLVFNRTGSLTISGVISGTGSVTNDGTGTVILAANNTYSGGTTINAGTLQIGNGGATGAVDPGDPIVNNGTLIFNSSATFTMAGTGLIGGTGNVIVRGTGTLKAIGANSYTGWTTIDAGATFQPAEGQTGTLLSSVVTNNGTLKLVRQDNWTDATGFGYTNNIVGSGRVIKDVNNPNPGTVLFLGTNTYAGGTIIAGGGIVLGDGGTIGAGSIVGNVVFTNSPTGNDNVRTLQFNRPDDLTFSGNITGPGATLTGGLIANAGSVVQSGSGTVTLTGNNTYLAGTTISSGTLQVGAGGTSGSIGTGPVTDNGTLVFNRSDNLTLSNVISGGGSLVKLGAGSLTLAATNTYAGTTTVSNGTLVINGDNSSASTIVYGGTLGGTGAFSGPVTLEPGTTLAPGASIGTLTINSDLSIGGNLAIEVNKSLSLSNDLVVVSGVLANTGTGTLTVANFGPALNPGDKFTLFSQPLQNGAALTVTGAGATWANNLAVDGSITASAVSRPTLSFTRTGNTLQFTWPAGFGNYKLQAQTNSINVGLSNNWADYPGGGTSPVTVPIDATKATVFIRLVSTP